MWRRLLTTSVAVAGLAMAVAASADARTTMTRTHVSSSTSVHAGTTFRARAEARGPHFRPHGWSEGRKTGWHCRVGTRSCVPPGLR
jgi:hypothetical protein